MAEVAPRVVSYLRRMAILHAIVFPEYVLTPIPFHSIYAWLSRLTTACVLCTQASAGGDRRLRLRRCALGGSSIGGVSPTARTDTRGRTARARCHPVEGPARSQQVRPSGVGSGSELKTGVEEDNSPLPAGMDGWQIVR